MKAALATTLAASLTLVLPVAERFNKLSGSQIRSRIAGMSITDDIHYRDIYERNGTLVSYGMGRKIIGKWRVERDQLCVERGDDGDCYAVWMSGNKIELRREGSSLPIEGVVEKPSARRP